MGERVSYNKLLTENKSLKDNLRVFYSEFRDWAFSNEERLRNKYNEKFLREGSLDFLKNNLELRDFEYYEQKILDQITFEFIKFLENRKLIESIDPCRYTHYYLTSTKLIAKIGDLELQEVWNYLIKGRSIKNDKEFIPINFDSPIIGFWDEVERLVLKDKIEELIFHLKYVEVVKESNIPEGLYFVLSALKEIEEHKNDLIFYVESPYLAGNFDNYLNK